MGRVLPIAVFLSGPGTTFDAVAEAIAGGHLPARIALVLADRPHAGGVELARHRGLPTAVRPIHGVSVETWAKEVDGLLLDRGVELVVLAGFLAVVPTPLLARWRGRIINVHPALLPRHGGRGMYGIRVHAAVLAAGDTVSGATVHLVTEALDGGPVLLREELPVAPGETAEGLQAKVRPLERRLLMEAIRRFAEGDWPLPYPVPDATASPAGPADPPH